MPRRDHDPLRRLEQLKDRTIDLLTEWHTFALVLTADLIGRNVNRDQVAAVRRAMKLLVTSDPRAGLLRALRMIDEALAGEVDGGE